MSKNSQVIYNYSNLKERIISHNFLQTISSGPINFKFKLIQDCRVLILFSIFGDIQSGRIELNGNIIAYGEPYGEDGYAFQTVVDMKKDNVIYCTASQVAKNTHTNLTMLIVN